MPIPLIAWALIGLGTTAVTYFATRDSSTSSSSSDDGERQARERAEQQRRQQEQARQQRQMQQLLSESRGEAESIFSQLNIQAAAMSEQQLRRFVGGQSSTHASVNELAWLAGITPEQMPALSSLITAANGQHSAALTRSMRHQQQQQKELDRLKDIAGRL